MPRVHVFLMLLVALLSVLATPAAAQRTNAPPGNAAIDEYLETVPGVSGDAPARPPLASLLCAVALVVSRRRGRT